jgi:hypothetical protein
MSESLPGSRPAVSFVIVGRNDDYMGDYLYRLGTSLSFLARSVEAAGLRDDVEVIVVDWASPRPLAGALPLGEAARRITRFLEVTPEMVRARWGTERWVPSCAVNVGVRRARGEFIFFTDSDCLWSESAMAALGRLLRGEIALPVPIARLFCYVRRSQIPWATVSRKPRLDEWSRLVAVLSAGVKPESPAISCLGGLSAGQLMHRDLWLAARGYDERLDRPWGWTDNDLMLRVTQEHPWLDVSGSGFFGLHMEHWPDAVKRLARDAGSVNPMVIRNEPTVNDPDWGLAGVEIPAVPCGSAVAPASGAGCEVPLSGAGASGGWRVDADAVDFVRRIGADRELPQVPLNRLAAIAAMVLAERPRNIYWFGPIDRSVMRTMLRACPAAELFLVNPWPEGAADALPLHPGHLAEFLGFACRFAGWARIVQGDPVSAMERIHASSMGDVSIELAWIGPGTPLAVVRDVAAALAPGGMVLTVEAGHGAATLERVRDAAAGCVTHALDGTGLIAATRTIHFTESEETWPSVVV